jgi:lambda family phage portal protein
MNGLDRLIAAVAPRVALSRARARQALMHYDAATAGRRVGTLRATGTDADASANRRQRMAYLARDMVRNTPFAARAQQVITNNTVGDGIVPRIAGLPKEQQRDMLRLIETVLDTPRIDAAGRLNLYGLQRLVMNAVVDAGEALVVAEWQAPPYGPKAFPLKLRVLEPDFLDDSFDHQVQSDGGWVHNGIKYNADGRRVAYRIFKRHPGADAYTSHGWTTASDWVPAQHVLHVYRLDRPGQERGVTWFAPVVLTLQDHADYQDAQIMRQKVAACFAGFRNLPDTTAPANAPSMGGDIEPGLIQDLYGEESVTFSDPPDVGGYDEFTKVTLRSAAAALGLTYEALTGDLSNVNFSSARMGRMEMDRSVSSWQWTMLVPQMLQPVGEWLLEAWSMWLPDMAPVIRAARIDWVPPSRVMVDPAREMGALKEGVRAGFLSRSGVIRGMGVDPERLLEEQAADQQAADAASLVFDSDARVAQAGSPAQVGIPVEEKPTERNIGDDRE